MTYRTLLLFLLFTACSQDASEEALIGNPFVTIIQEPLPDDFDPTLVREITTTTGRYLTGSAAAITGRLVSGARPQVQWLQSEEARFRGLFLKVIPAPGVLFSNDTLLATYLDAINARLTPTDTANYLLQLRADAIGEDITLSSTAYPGSWSETASLDSLATYGIQLTNDTGHPLHLDRETMDFYLPSLRAYFGDSLATTRFWLEVDTVRGMKLMENK